MFGRRNPDQMPAPQPPAPQNSAEKDIDLDLLPDLPIIPPPVRPEPEPEPPPSDPAWHAGVLMRPSPAPWETLAPAPPPAPAAPAAPATPPAVSTPPPASPTAPTMPAFRAPAAPQPAAPQPAAPAPASERPPVTRPKPSSESVIGPDDFFDGRYRSERGVRIQGNARGSIESRQYIFVEGGAEVEADLSAEDITVAGSFNGKIECRRRLEIASTGKVQGQVTTALLVDHEGGLIDGELHMRRDEGQPVKP
jgi:cytoskeletal protein CcmA (bactofilin family)